MVEAEVLTAAAAHTKWLGLNLADYISQPSQHYTAAATNTTATAASASLAAPLSSSSSPASSSLVEQASNRNVSSSEPTPWFHAITKATKASANPFVGPESRHLADGGGLLLASHLSDLDSSPSSISMGGGPGAEEWAKQGSDFARPSTPLAELRRSLRLVLALAHLCVKLQPTTHSQSAPQSTPHSPDESHPDESPPVATPPSPRLWYQNLLSASSLEDLHGGIGGERPPSELSSVSVCAHLCGRMQFVY